MIEKSQKIILKDMIPIRKTNQLPTIENFLNDFFGATSFIYDKMNENYSGINTIENENSYELSIALPGYKKEDISIDIEDDTLIVSSDIEDKIEESNVNYIRKQFKKTSFTKRFIITENIDKEKINAKMEDGVLYITLNKFIKPDININKKINID